MESEWGTTRRGAADASQQRDRRTDVKQTKQTIPAKTCDAEVEQGRTSWEILDRRPEHTRAQANQCVNGIEGRRLDRTDRGLAHVLMRIPVRHLSFVTNGHGRPLWQRRNTQN